METQTKNKLTNWLMVVFFVVCLFWDTPYNKQANGQEHTHRKSNKLTAVFFCFVRFDMLPTISNKQTKNKQKTNKQTKQTNKQNKQTKQTNKQTK